MEFSANFDFIGPVLQISLIDLLLSGDNAILIAMACQSLPAELRRKAVFLGTGVAVVFRVFMTFAATLALRAPYLKLIGAVLLLLIAIELLASNDEGRKAQSVRDPSAGIWRAIVLVVVADAVMSLDNVVAVAAAAQDSVLYLIFGLLLSVPILIFSSLFVVRVLDAYPILIQAGAALLGWIAGKTAVSDPVIASVLEAQSFGLVTLAPVLGAVYVLLQGRILREQRGLPAAFTSSPARLRVAPAVPIAKHGPPVRTAVAEAAPGAFAARVVAVQAASAGFASAAPPRTMVSDSPVLKVAVPVIERAPEPAVAQARTTHESAQREAAPDAPVQADAAASVPAVKRFTTMDLTIMAGVAVPALGLLATLIYIIAKAIGSH